MDEMVIRITRRLYDKDEVAGALERLAARIRESDVYMVDGLFLDSQGTTMGRVESL